MTVRSEHISCHVEDNAPADARRTAIKVASIVVNGAGFNFCLFTITKLFLKVEPVAAALWRQPTLIYGRILWYPNNLQFFGGNLKF